ncbi:tissue factor [Alligator mississippiensis]|uniref:Tissue factor n=2 Tax=Alligator mississippiensis TaxID=8496 RepID=A0A151M582_ALLMI|nr:tissue factor [Alligator mississippiensis]
MVPGRTLLLGALLALAAPGSGNSEVPTAVNITWTSINFKTLLKWLPEPTNYAYTVEIFGIHTNIRRKCIHTKETVCDVTDIILENVKDTYTAHIVSDMLSNIDDFDEKPYAASPKFTPYKQTLIGKPTIQSSMQNGSKLIVLVQDPFIPSTFPNESLKSIRDIFKDDLEYVLYYWKDKSSGKKNAKTKSNQFEIDVDKEENYCFFVQATVPSRTENRNSLESKVACTSISRNILHEYQIDLFVIIGAAVLVIIIIIIVVSVVIYKCKKEKAETVKEKTPLNDV